MKKIKKKGMVYDNLVKYILILGFIVAAIIIIVNFKTIFEKLVRLVK